MKEHITKLLWMLCLILAVCAVWVFGFLQLRSHYRKALNHETAQIYNIVHTQYPNVSDEELLAVLRGEGPEADDSFLAAYGYTDSRIFSAEARSYERVLFFYGLAGILLLGLAVLGYLHFLMRQRARNLEELIQYIQDIDRGLYDLKIGENSEERISLLSNELYKITTLLRESADRSRKDSESLNRSLQDISHQLKTPLTSMRIMLDNIADNPDMPADMRMDFLDSISQQVDRISSLVVSLLHLARFDSGVIRMQPEPVSIGQLLDEVLDGLSILSEVKEISYERSGDMDASIQLDRRWETEALRNIIKNCLEHSPEGSCIHLQAQDSSLFLKLTIRDEGEGIAPEDLHHIFERFYKARNSAEGSIGIGLSFAKTIIENDNGFITASSVPQEGTTFEIRWKK